MKWVAESAFPAHCRKGWFHLIRHNLERKPWSQLPVLLLSRHHGKEIVLMLNSYHQPMLCSVLYERFCGWRKFQGDAKLNEKEVACRCRLSLRLFLALMVAWGVGKMEHFRFYVDYVNGNLCGNRWKKGWFSIKWTARQFDGLLPNISKQHLPDLVHLSNLRVVPISPRNEKQKPETF